MGGVVGQNFYAHHRVPILVPPFDGLPEGVQIPGDIIRRRLFGLQQRGSVLQAVLPLVPIGVKEAQQTGYRRGGRAEVGHGAVGRQLIDNRGGGFVEAVVEGIGKIQRQE